MSYLSADDYTAFPIEEADLRTTYGEDPNHFIDLFLPEQMVALAPAPKVPVVLLIHGGCWRAQYGLSQLGQVARALNQVGVAVCNIEYRRLGNGGGWPATFQDVAQAADSLRELAHAYNLDLSRVVAAGHSAGGHLALWLACRHQLKGGQTLFTSEPLPLKGVVSLAGIPDMVEAVHREICRGAPQELLGGLPNEVAAHYMEGSPAGFLPLSLPHIHVTGVEDRIVPLDYVERFVTAAQACGDPAESVAVVDAGHFEIVSPSHVAWQPVQEAILRLLAV